MIICLAYGSAPCKTVVVVRRAVISALLRPSEEDHKFKASLEYTVRTYLKQTLKGLLVLEGVIKAVSPEFLPTICYSFSNLGAPATRTTPASPPPKKGVPSHSLTSIQSTSEIPYL